MSDLISEGICIACTDHCTNATLEAVNRPKTVIATTIILKTLTLSMSFRSSTRLLHVFASNGALSFTLSYVMNIRLFLLVPFICSPLPRGES